MSVHVQGLCYRAKFGCPKRKAIAVALADHAHDDGSNVYPSVKRLADKVEWSERTVQRVLRELEEIGLLVVVSGGGAKPKDTREWSFNMPLLRALSDGQATIEEASEAMGDSQTPINGDGCQDRRLWVSGTTSMGDTAVTQTINNHQEPSARERAKNNSGIGKEEKPRPTVEITITVSDVSWSSWIDWLTANHPHLVDAAKHHGLIRASSRWPRPDSPTPRIAGLPRNVTGEAA